MFKPFTYLLWWIFFSQTQKKKKLVADFLETRSIFFNATENHVDQTKANVIADTLAEQIKLTPP